MKTYNVHVYETVRVKVVGVEAASQVEAIKAAVDYYNPHDLFDRQASQDKIELMKPIDYAIMLIANLLVYWQLVNPGEHFLSPVWDLAAQMILK